MAIESFQPTEAAIGDTISVIMNPHLVTNTGFEFALKVTVGGIPVEPRFTPDRFHVFFEVPHGLKPDTEQPIVIDDSDNIFESPYTLKIKSAGDGQGGPDLKPIVVNLSPRKVKRQQINEEEASFTPYRVTLEGSNLHIVTKVSLDNIRIPRITKEPNLLTINLPVTLPAPRNPAGYRILLNYGHSNEELIYETRLKVN